jgi:hypothetical protein
MPHYVYLYRDERGEPRYVGYGKLVTRANAHLIKSHNPQLANFVLEKKFTIEVAGPFETEATGRVVETTLISALKPKFNVVQGQSEDRFRPLGVPAAYAERLAMPPMKRSDFFSMQTDPPMPVLFVSVGEKDFGDGRAGYDFAAPPADEKVLERVEKWWQLSNLIPVWAKKPDQSPGLLVGISGSPGAQILIASILVDRSGWNDAENCPQGGGKIRVPIKPTPKLDACGLRGRRVDRAAGFAFEGVPAGFFIVLKLDGTLIGGRRARK